MYEVWLMLNIFWEILRPVLPVLLVVLVIWLGLMLRAGSGKTTNWTGGLSRSLLVGVVVAVLAFFVLPGALKSDLSEMGYWADWLTLIGLSAGAGAVVAALLWPIFAARRTAR
ncbi:MAG: hypothetical protein KBA70_04450 [Aquabacterium sp.]|jgi:hypothetical protein|uniref:hypothetical protein n=1 Tax=Aquabacterium sp. TaxID=1872578 RepID=UPI001B77A990|nr:hypothetical protein [Aquabacterium sp.]MBP7131994.1 hypothetical protein [Aquabacterium sp.]MBP9063366.1 hypothetical protein [Aquabacterium sp.]MDQ5926065.1 hypothetical protein [Pseudomonadota bacterium]